MSTKKLSVLFAVPALTLSLAVCSQAEDSASSTGASAESSVAQEVATETQATTDQVQSQSENQTQPGTAQGDLPAEVTGYTGEAEAEMADEGVTAADVERVLAAANANEAGVSIEWDDDGYWEIEFDDIDIDVDPNGLVLDVDWDD